MCLFQHITLITIYMTWLIYIVSAAYWYSFCNVTYIKRYQIISAKSSFEARIKRCLVMMSNWWRLSWGQLYAGTRITGALNYYRANFGCTPRRPATVYVVSRFTALMRSFRIPFWSTPMSGSANDSVIDGPVTYKVDSPLIGPPTAGGFRSTYVTQVPLMIELCVVYTALCGGWQKLHR